jgi:hypothetical protein
VSGSPLFELMKCASRTHCREISSSGHQTVTAVVKVITVHAALSCEHRYLWLPVLPAWKHELIYAQCNKEQAVHFVFCYVEAFCLDDQYGAGWVISMLLVMVAWFLFATLIDTFLFWVPGPVCNICTS